MTVHPEDDPCAVSQPLEIQSIFLDMLSRRVLLHLDIPGQDVAIISTLLAVDTKAGVLLLDNAAEEHLDALFMRAAAVRLQGQLDRIMIECTGAIHAATHDGLAAFAMALPRQVRRLQRREYFRVDVPASSPATCDIHHPGLPGGQVNLPLADISAGGLLLADRDQLLSDIAIGTVLDSCRLALPDSAALDLRLQLLRFSQRPQENGKTLSLAAFRYIDLPAARQISIQQYISGLERAVLARRWGSE